MLPIAPSTYYDHASRQVDPVRQPPRWHREQALASQIDRVWQENRQTYGARKVWRQLHREGVKVARCTVERLMRRAGLQGVVRGKPRKWIGQELVEEKPMDLVKRQFTADRPNALWVSDFTYVPTWQGFVYVAFVIDVFARRIVGWRARSSQQTQFVLDALEQAVWARRPAEKALIHHSDRGSQYLSIRYTDRLIEAGIEPSVGSVGDSYDNALAETVIGLFKTEVTHRRSWRSREEVEGRPSVGSTGITIADCWGRSATYPRQKRRRRTTLATRVTPSRRDSNEMASGEAGAIQKAVTLAPFQNAPDVIPPEKSRPAYFNPSADSP